MSDLSFINLLALHSKALIVFLRVKLFYVVVVSGSFALSTNCPGTIVVGGNCLEDNCPGDNYLEAIFLETSAQGDNYHPRNTFYEVCKNIF